MRRASHKIVIMHPARTPRRPQARTEATKAKILDAAEALFSERGFENTQLDEIAVRANCSRGGIYAHYSSKEDLFLALMQHRVSLSFKETWKEIGEEPSLTKRRNLFKHWFIQQICSPRSGTLTLEFKLYAVRRPEKREELLGLYNSLFLATGDSDPLQTLFGKNLTKAKRTEMEQRLVVLGGALSALILESRFRSGFLTATHLQKFSEEIFDALLHV